MRPDPQEAVRSRPSEVLTFSNPDISHGFVQIGSRCQVRQRGGQVRAWAHTAVGTTALWAHVGVAVVKRGSWRRSDRRERPLPCCRDLAAAPAALVVRYGGRAQLARSRSVGRGRVGHQHRDQCRHSPGADRPRPGRALAVSPDGTRLIDPRHPMSCSMQLVEERRVQHGHLATPLDNVYPVRRPTAKLRTAPPCGSLVVPC